MARPVTFQTLIEDTRRWANIRTSTPDDAHQTDSDVARILELKLAELHEMLTSSTASAFVETEADVGIVNGAGDLPEDFFRLNAAWVVWSSSDHEPLTNLSNQQYAASYAGSSWTAGASKAFRIVGSQLRVFPAATSATVRIAYVPAFATADEYDGVNGWEKYVTVGAAIEILAIENRTNAALEREYERQSERILSMIEERQAQDPPRIRDASCPEPSRSCGGGGTGGGGTTVPISVAASAVTYSPTAAALQSTNVQGALDELGGYATMALLRAVAPVNGKQARTRTFATDGDGGGGLWRGVVTAPLTPGTYTHNGGTVLVPFGGDGSAAWLREYTGAVYPEWWGVGGGDDSAAFAAARAVASGGGTVRLSDRTYIVASDIDPGEGITWKGSGRGRTVVNVVGNPSGDRVFISTGVDRTSVAIEDMDLVGEWLADQQQTGANGLITLTQYTDVRISNVGLHYGRTFGININNCRKVLVDSVTGRYCTRDMIGVWNTPDVQITNCDILGSDDDGISVNIDGTVQLPVRSRVIITGNILRDTSPIKVMAPKNVLIADNIIERAKGVGIHLNTQRGDGFYKSNASNVHVVNNVITDVMSRGWFVDGTDGSVDNRCYIRINGADIDAGSLAVPPGEIDPATGEMESPFDYVYATSGASNADPVRRSDGIRVSGNTCKRTLPAVTNYSDWGYGEAFASDGFVDFEVTETTLTGMAIEARLFAVSRLRIEDNDLLTGARGISFRFDNEADGLLRESSIKNNRISFCSEGGIIWPGTTLTHQDVEIEGNTVDCDPAHTHSNRGSNGTWLADANPTAFDVPRLGGAIFRNNKVRNCGRAVVNTGATANQEFFGNEVFCDAAQSGFSTSNAGVGNVPTIGSGEHWWIQYVECDPTDAAFGEWLGTNIRNSSGMPTAGKWLAGMFVRSRTTLPRELGWRRITTGSNHVLGTDWYALSTAHNGANPDRGDNSVTLNPVASDRIQRWNTPLTTNRTVTLTTTNAEDGLTWRVVRGTAATGGSTLDVGGLKTLAVGEWCDVTFDGSAYILTAFGAL